jgi:hypothetical protein
MQFRSRLVIFATTLGALVLVPTLDGAAPRAGSPHYSTWSVPVNLGPVVNSPWDDALAALSKDDLSLYFASNRPLSAGGDGSFDIWVSQRPAADLPWGSPIRLGPSVNTNAQEAGAALSRDGHWLFFHRTTVAGDFDLMASWRAHTNDDFAWGAAMDLGPAVNSASNDAGASYFAGDQDNPPQLFFGSTRFGGFDLFVSTLGTDGIFGPAELIPELSTAATDQRPSIRHDGREMFLTSNRPGSVSGSGDLWVSTRATVYDLWSAPVNVAELNTPFTHPTCVRLIRA